MTDLQANLDELKEHQREARALLVKSQSKTPAKGGTAKRKANHAGA
jgi:ribosomal protein L29